MSDAPLDNSSDTPSNTALDNSSESKSERSNIIRTFARELGLWIRYNETRWPEDDSLDELVKQIYRVIQEFGSHAVGLYQLEELKPIITQTIQTAFHQTNPVTLLEEIISICIIQIPAFIANLDILSYLGLGCSIEKAGRIALEKIITECQYIRKLKPYAKCLELDIKESENIFADRKDADEYKHLYHEREEQIKKVRELNFRCKYQTKNDLAHYITESSFNFLKTYDVEIERMCVLSLYTNMHNRLSIFNSRTFDKLIHFGIDPFQRYQISDGVSINLFECMLINRNNWRDLVEFIMKRYGADEIYFNSVPTIWHLSYDYTIKCAEAFGDRIHAYHHLPNRVIRGKLPSRPKLKPEFYISWIKKRIAHSSKRLSASIEQIPRTLPGWDSNLTRLITQYL